MDIHVKRYIFGTTFTLSVIEVDYRDGRGMLDFGHACEDEDRGLLRDEVGIGRRPPERGHISCGDGCAILASLREHPLPTSFIGHLASVVGLAALVACGPSDADIDRLVAARLVAEGLIKPPVELASPGAAELSAPTLDPVAESLLFLATLDELMKDYEPVMADDVDNADVMRCLTTDARKNDPALSKASKSLEKAKDEADRMKRKAVQIFAESVPLQSRIDYGWSSRHSASRTVFGCWMGGRFHGVWDTDCHSAECCTDVYWPPEIVWKVRGTEARAEFLYSGTTAPASPELMKRIDGAHITIPNRFSCMVEDVWPKDDHRTIDCVGGPQVRVFGESTARPNVGDVVSVPLANVNRDPNGVLWKSDGTWVVDADATTLTRDALATCPTTDEILASAGFAPPAAGPAGGSSPASNAGKDGKAAEMPPGMPPGMPPAR